ncbi:MAG: hypothetical protein LBP72_08675 [Dysgonamonadaceae bacterium]|jgi:hypothetical protein|nr:hypothetical protein [Dysgonamonadaceae bacterium]
MIHYFNPGHETAVLNGSPFYQPPAQTVKMQADLAFLPAWYADSEDYVLINNPFPYLCRCSSFCRYMIDSQRENIERIPLSSPAARAIGTERVALWGISPQSIHLFEKINRQYNLHFQTPAGSEEYREAAGRRTSQKALALLIDEIPEIEKDILPQFFSTIDEIERYLLRSNEKQVVKSPFSSSGRGLVWLPPGKIAQSERQIISGMLKKQSSVSIEKALDKQMDFSMHFENTPEGETQFIGYSVFQTNGKGVYEKSLLARQEDLEKRIAGFIDKALLLRVRKALNDFIHRLYIPHYTGNIGVDMLIYRSGNTYKLHPCVEINMRKSMGYLAIRLFEKHVHPDSQGELVIEYNPDPLTVGKKQKERLVCENGQIKTGQLNLCPVSKTTKYYAHVKLTTL